MFALDSIILLSLELLQLSHFCGRILWRFGLTSSFLCRFGATSLNTAKWLRLCHWSFMLSSCLKHHPELHWFQLPFGCFVTWHFFLLPFFLPSLLLFIIFYMIFLFWFHNSVSLRVEFFSLINKHFFTYLWMFAISHFIKRPSTTTTLCQIWILLWGIHRRLLIFWNLKIWVFVQWNVIHVVSWIHVEFHFVWFWGNLDPLRPSLLSSLRCCNLFLRSLNLKWFFVLSGVLRSIGWWICWLVVKVRRLRSIS